MEINLSETEIEFLGSDDFTHHNLAAENPLSKDILYRLRADEYFHQAQETI